MILETLLIGIALTIDFRDCPIIGIVWTIEVWCFQSIGIVQTNDVGDCLSIGIVQTNDLGDCLLTGSVLKNVFSGCLWIGIAWKIDFGWFRCIEIAGTTLGTTAFGNRPLIGIIRTIEFWRALLFENQQLLCRVQLIALVSTLHKLPLTGWRSSLYTQPFARYKLLH